MRDREIWSHRLRVVALGAAAALVILWGKVAVQHLRESRRPKLVLALWVVGIALLFVLSFLGLKLPREGG